MPNTAKDVKTTVFVEVKMDAIHVSMGTPFTRVNVFSVPRQMESTEHARDAARERLEQCWLVQTAQ